MPNINTIPEKFVLQDNIDEWIRFVKNPKMLQISNISDESGSHQLSKESTSVNEGFMTNASATNIVVRARYAAGVMEGTSCLICNITAATNTGMALKNRTPKERDRVLHCSRLLMTAVLSLV
mmetsp:Transcript_7628/g.11074  ORF Transcript_7628/g.11074 Transcript_7628/m.11074 type:complete len:122 (+) Transcript_7628:2006-2371(+)